ncbi:LuxR C-terminal-related transcriptional regulator [Streptomyces collinus]|uniref:LuxR C-terminal-related transcriptional regulator n=1 Tax=Streptomyces collinus TaxID=42684 RepID=UPI00382568B0
MTTSIRVFLAKSEKLVLDGIERLIDGYPEFSVVGTAQDWAAMARGIQADTPDIVITEFQLPGMTVIEASTVIRRELPGAKIVILDANQQPLYVWEAIRAGVCGFLSMQMDTQELRRALLSVHRDGAMLTPSIANRVLKAVAGGSDATDPLSTLTDRERSILYLLADDYDTRSIAVFLHLSPKTVRNYLSRIYIKIRVRDRFHAALYAKRILDRPGGAVAEP